MRYMVNMYTVASAGIEVEAENRDEAIEAAFDKGVPGICAQCSGWNRDYYLEVNSDWELCDAPYDVEELG